VKVGFHGVGAVVHPDRRDHLPEPGQLAQLQEYVRRWLPGLDAESPDPVSCTYTSTPTGEFVLDRIGPVVVAAGFSGHGFKSATAIGRVLADLAIGAPANAAPFGLAAHATLT
jgi:sarcosine oxidase